MSRSAPPPSTPTWCATRRRRPQHGPPTALLPTSCADVPRRREEDYSVGPPLVGASDRCSPDPRQHAAGGSKVGLPGQAPKMAGRSYVDSTRTGRRSGTGAPGAAGTSRTPRSTWSSDRIVLKSAKCPGGVWTRVAKPQPSWTACAKSPPTPPDPQPTRLSPQTGRATARVPTHQKGGAGQSDREP